MEKKSFKKKFVKKFWKKIKKLSEKLFFAFFFLKFLKIGFLTFLFLLPFMLINSKIPFFRFFKIFLKFFF